MKEEMLPLYKVVTKDGYTYHVYGKDKEDAKDTLKHVYKVKSKEIIELSLVS